MKHEDRHHPEKSMFKVEFGTDQMGFGLPKKEGQDFHWLTVHPRTQCLGDEFCGIHNPSAHPINEQEWPYSWRADLGHLERICPHGIGHPDPDGLAFARTQAQMRGKEDTSQGMHGCDGCCSV